LKDSTLGSGLLRSYLVSAFAGDVVLSIFYIYLPLFSYELGASTFEVGIVGGASYLVYAILPIFIGRFSDKIKSKSLLLLLAFALVTLCSFLYGITPNTTTLAVVRVFEGLGWAIIWPVLEAGISQVTSKSFESQRALGVYNYVWSAAAALGPLVGAVFVFVFTIRDTFFVTCFLLIIALAVNLPYLRTASFDRSYHPDEEPRISGTPNFRKAVIDLVKRHFVIITATVLVLMTDTTLLTFFPAYAESRGISILLIGALTFSFGASRFVTYLLISRERIRHSVISYFHRTRNVLVSLSAAVVSGVFLSFNSFGYISYLFGFVLLGIGFAIVTTIAQIELITEAPIEKMGTGAGLLESCVGTGSFLGPILGGLISSGSLVVTFFVPLLIFVIMLPIIGVYLTKVKRARLA
jgi:MFS family permease